jgi:hypothetical protein
MRGDQMHSTAGSIASIRVGLSGLKQSIVEYFDYIEQERAGVDDYLLSMSLPDYLQDMVKLNVLQDLVFTLPLFSPFDDAMKRAIVLALEPSLYFKKEINQKAKESEGLHVEDLDEKVVHNAAAYSIACISPMAAFFGGLVAQEIVKYTGKYSPLKQWLHYDIFESLPRTPVDRTPLNCRYDD